MIYFLSHPIQYFSPLLKKLSEQNNLEVYYYTDNRKNGNIDKGFGKAVSWDTPLLEGYSYHFLHNYRKNKITNSRLWDVINPGIPSAIRRSKDKVVIVNGWSYSSDWLVVITARLCGKKLWLRAENPLNQELRKKRFVRAVKKILLDRILFSLFTDKCLYIGTENKKFFQYYGVPDHKLLFTPYSVDNDFFYNAWLRHKQALPELKMKFGLPPDKKIILFTGKYILKKRPMDLLESLRQLDADKYFLVMVGEGELRSVMENYMREHSLNNVLLTGFINQSLIPEYYAIADVFVMCSGMGETWGLTVNEAMNFEKPVIVSDTCGCSVDLVQQGVNGYTFPEGNIGLLTARIKDATEDAAVSERMGRASLEIIQSYSIGVIVDNIQQANDEHI